MPQGSVSHGARSAEHKHSALGSSVCPQCVALRPPVWTYSDAYRKCLAGCDIKRGARYYRDALSIYCVEHAPSAVVTHTPHSDS